MRRSDRIVIIGAGPCGLGAALWLAEKGHDNFIVLEAADHPGGLSASFVDESGFVWDLGGHVVFSHYAEFDAVLDRTVSDWIFHERESWIRTQGRWIPYPFQYNIHRLAPAQRDAVLADLRQLTVKGCRGKLASFAEWITEGFGPTMEAIFLGPYNRKVWGYPLETMGTGWLGERVAAPDLERVQRNVRENRDDPGWGPNATFRFPARGGTGAIWRGAAAALPNGRIRYGTPVTAVDFDKRSVSLANGSEERWDALLSTAPLDWLCQHASGLPGHTSVKANRLGYSSTHVVGVGLRGGKPAALAEKCWMYFPDANSPYYRVTHFSHYSPANAPAGCWSLMAEVCESRHKPVDAGKVVPLTLAALRQDGLIETNADVVATWHRRMERGYPIPLRDRDELLAEVMASLEAKGALSRGRFGGWRYEIGNMDHCFMQGREATARILEGCTETTWVQS